MPATVKTPDQEIILRDVPVDETLYNLSGLSPSGRSTLQQVNATLAQSCQPFVDWRLEWVSGGMVYGILKVVAYDRFLFQFRAVGGILYYFGFAET